MRDGKITLGCFYQILVLLTDHLFKNPNIFRDAKLLEYFACNVLCSGKSVKRYYYHGLNRRQTFKSKGKRVDGKCTSRSLSCRLFHFPVSFLLPAIFFMVLTIEKAMDIFLFCVIWQIKRTILFYAVTIMSFNMFILAVCS